MGAKSAPKTCKWRQKAPPKPQSGGRKRPRTNQSRKSVEAKSAVKMQKWGRKAPSKQQSDGKKRHHSDKRENAMVAESAIKMEKWWRKTPLKQQSDGKKRHHISNCGGILTTTYHIQGAGAPAKTENYVNADAFIFFREKVRPFPHLAKPMNTFLRKVGKAMVQIKRDWFDTALENYERGEIYGRWKEKIQV